MLISPFGAPIVTKHPMSLDKLKRFMEFEDVLKQNGWTITCTNCARVFGYGKDGVEGNNDASGTRFVVKCGCAEHVFDASGS